MARIRSVELTAVDLPFRKPFKHAAAERNVSTSLFLKCVSDSGEVGFGEALPREYVTGESRHGAFELLKDRVLPRLLDLQFESLRDVREFLSTCDGKAPSEWIAPDQPQTAAWCAVDLALLDTFGRVFGESVSLNDNSVFPATVRYSVVISSEVSLKTLLLIRLAGIRQVKLKVEETANDAAISKCRRFLGSGCDIRVDANMAWDVEQAVKEMRRLAEFGIRSFEQPVSAENIEGLTELVNRTDGLDVMADESLSDKASLDTLISRKACTAANIRVSKCGGLVAAFQRCREALDAGLTLQIGCQVGESSLLSAAQLALIQAVPEVKYLEGCFGKLLLKKDPGEPLLQFGWQGKPPKRPGNPGLGVTINEEVLNRWVVRRETSET
jgi:L-alanine-DL-glutamate epimerase-like enolase superfamily enzyme